MSRSSGIKNNKWIFSKQDWQLRDAILAFFLILSFISCNNTDHSVLKSSTPPRLQIIRQQFNKVEVGYYVNFKKSPITHVYLGGDSTFLHFTNFINESKTPNSCALDSNIPDGHMTILKDSITLMHLEFILNGECKGFYSDFTNNPQKYDISAEGILELTKLMDKTNQNTPK